MDSPFSAVVFKVQSNMDPAHRDRIAFLRVCSGRFERGMAVACGDTGKSVATKYAHTVVGRDRSTAEEAWPGDVIGLVNAADLRVGDSVHAPGGAVRWTPVPAFAPTSFRVARCTDTSKAKQFRSGVRQLDSEGVVQVLRRPESGESAPILAAVGPLQFDVAEHRLRHEFGAPVELAPAPWTTARLTDEASAATLGTMSGVAIVERAESGRTTGPVREPLLAGPPPSRPPRTHPGAPHRRRLTTAVGALAAVSFDPQGPEHFVGGATPLVGL